MRRASPFAGLALAIVPVLLAASSPAAAQQAGLSMTVQPTPFLRLDKNGNSLSRNYPPPNERAITRADCEEDTAIKVTLTATGVCGNCPIQIWAGPTGVDCKDYNARQGTLQRCWRIGDSSFKNGGQEITLRVQDILRDWGNGTPKSTTYVRGTAEACNVDRYETPDATSNIVFLVSDGGQGTKVDASFQLPVRMKGPLAPSITKVTALEGLISVDFSYPAGNTDILGYVAYCTPKPGTEDPSQASTINDVATCEPNAFGPVSSESSALQTKAAFPAFVPQVVDDAGADADASDADTTADADTDASGGTTGGTSTGGSTAGTTDAGVTVYPSPAAIPDSYECARVENNIASNIKIRDAKVGYAYAVSIAAYDIFKVRGTPSPYACAVPVEVTDFWDAYKAYGGSGGGGFCALEGAGLPTGMGALGIVSVAGMLGAARRRRRP